MRRPRQPKKEKIKNLISIQFLNKPFLYGKKGKNSKIKLQGFAALKYIRLSKRLKQNKTQNEDWKYYLIKPIPSKASKKMDETFFT
jgi:hypothetical protein